MSCLVMLSSKIMLWIFKSSLLFPLVVIDSEFHLECYVFFPPPKKNPNNLNHVIIINEEL